MNFLELKAYAKINLGLDVIRKREDGYHDLKMIMQTVDLHDRIKLEVIKNGIEIVCRHPFVPSDRRNLAYKAAELFINRYGIKRGIRIVIDKRIPVAAGLAGGSSDAAAVLKGMNQLFSTDLEITTLMADGKELGADIPYCINGGTMLAEGIGDILTRLRPLEKVPIVIIKPRVSASTAWVYNNLNVESINDRPDMNLLQNAVNDGKINILAKNMKNVLETVTEKRYPVITQAKKRLIELGALGSIMSGSGPSVFGIFDDQEKAKNAYKEVSGRKWDSFLTYMTST